MQTEIAQTIFEKVKILSLDEQKEVLEIVEKKVSVSQKKDSRPIWEVIAEISSRVPEEEWAKLPADGAENYDHYLYGAPKKQK
ncbi:hypothetical protein BH20ACI1_BH20ACI1_07920 [soil metagenome]